MVITVTDAAREQIEALLASRGGNKALHLSISGRSPDGFEYRFRLIDPTDAAPGDHRVEWEKGSVIVQQSDFDHISGSTLDYYTLGGGGFHIENPNAVFEDEMAQAVHKVVVEKINPGIAMHGGYVTLVNVKGGDAYIEFGGGCMGCGASQVTLKHGIERMIREAVPEVGQIIDVTDHASGSNPYYAPETKGESPLEDAD